MGGQEVVIIHFVAFMLFVTFAKKKLFCFVLLQTTIDKNVWKASRIMCAGEKGKRRRQREKIGKERWRTEGEREREREAESE